MCKVSARWYSFLLGTIAAIGIPSAALAQTPLTWAKVETLRNRVHLVPSGRRARLATVSDVMNIGDALRTSSSARAELRFNDGSLARVGERATFRFTPDTRNFQLSNGTVLLLIPPGRGRTTIQTPNAVTGIQGSALFVRVKCAVELSADGSCSAPITIVGALTNNPAGAMMAFNDTGSQQQPIYAGEMVVIENDSIVESLEFDLRTFYETSGLAEGLGLDHPTPPSELTEDLQGVWQEIQDALELQGDFDSHTSPEEIVINPGFIAPAPETVGSANSDLDNLEFADFPAFTASPAAGFHNLGTQIATGQPSDIYTEPTSIEQSASNPNGLSLAEPSASARVPASTGINSDVGTSLAANAGTQAVTQQVVTTPSVPTTTAHPPEPTNITPAVTAPPEPTNIAPTVTAPDASNPNTSVRTPASGNDFNLNNGGATPPDNLVPSDLSQVTGGGENPVVPATN